MVCYPAGWWKLIPDHIRVQVPVCRSGLLVGALVSPLLIIRQSVSRWRGQGVPYLPGKVTRLKGELSTLCPFKRFSVFRNQKFGTGDPMTYPRRDMYLFRIKFHSYKSYKFNIVRKRHLLWLPFKGFMQGHGLNLEKVTVWNNLFILLKLSPPQFT